MTYNPIITITLKPTVGAFAAIDAVETGKDHGTAAVTLSFEQQPEGPHAAVEGEGDIGAFGFSWRTMPDQRACGEVAELSAETALAFTKLLNLGFAMNAELNPPAVRPVVDDGPFQPPFGRTGEDHQNDDLSGTVAAEIADFSNLEADAKAVSSKLERAEELLRFAAAGDAICPECNGTAFVYTEGCDRCRGAGRVPKLIAAEITIPKRKGKKRT